MTTTLPYSERRGRSVSILIGKRSRMSSSLALRTRTYAGAVKVKSGLLAGMMMIVEIKEEATFTPFTIEGQKNRSIQAAWGSGFSDGPLSYIYFG